MHVDLEDRCQKLLVKTYVDCMLNAQSSEELMFDAHKLIHTYEVVQAAKELIDLTTPALDTQMVQTILDGALLHDIGRVKQFHQGRYVLRASHAHMGAAILEQEIPEYTTVIETTRWHTNVPSQNDPAEHLFVLNYVRDADMIANLRYNIVRAARFFEQVKEVFGPNGLNVDLDAEVIGAAQEGRSLRNKSLTNISFLNSILGQLLWGYNLRTPAAIKIAKKENLFPRLRDVLAGSFMDKLQGTDAQKQHSRSQILELFPDNFFNALFER